MGNRTMIIKNSHRMIDLMGNAPFFVMSHSEDDLQNWRLLFIEPLTDKILAVL
jgi:hypothetical protein